MSNDGMENRPDQNPMDGPPRPLNRQEIRRFASVGEWSRRLQSVGFHDTGRRLLQANDPSDNVLMAFRKKEMERA